MSRDSVEGKPGIAYYLEADLKDRRLRFTTQWGGGKRYTPMQYYQQEDSPLVVVNGTFFSFQTSQNLNILIRNGEMLSYNIPAIRMKGKDSLLFQYPTRSAIGISKKRRADVAWIFTDTASRWPYASQAPPVLRRGSSADPELPVFQTDSTRYKKWKMQTAIGGGPVLVQNGKLKLTNREELMFVGGEKDRHPRTAMGYTRDGRLIILMIQGRFPGLAEGATLEQEARILIALGCTEALNLDGGGSSCMLVNGKETIKPSDKEGQRAVPGVFVIY